MATGRGGGMSAGQVVLVTFGFLIASFLVFIFGMWVGKDIAERRLAQEERVFRAPVVRPTAAAVAEVPAPARPAPTTNNAIALAAVTPQPVFQLPGEAKSPTPAPAMPTITPTLNLVVLTPRAASPRPTSGPVQVPTPDAAAPGPNPDEWADAGWTIQVTATTDAAGAEAVAARLRSRGYDAYTVKAPARGQVWYRVRIGRYATKAEAEKTEERLKSVEKLSGAFVTAR